MGIAIPAYESEQTGAKKAEPDYKEMLERVLRGERLMESELQGLPAGSQVQRLPSTVTEMGQPRQADDPRLGEYLQAMKQSGGGYTVDRHGQAFEPGGALPEQLTQGQRKTFVDRQPYGEPVQGLTPAQREMHVDRMQRDRARLIEANKAQSPSFSEDWKMLDRLGRQ